MDTKRKFDNKHLFVYINEILHNSAMGTTNIWTTRNYVVNRDIVINKDSWDTNTNNKVYIIYEYQD